MSGSALFVKVAPYSLKRLDSRIDTSRSASKACLNIIVSVSSDNRYPSCFSTDCVAKEDHVVCECVCWCTKKKRWKKRPKQTSLRGVRREAASSFVLGAGACGCACATALVKCLNIAVLLKPHTQTKRKGKKETEKKGASLNLRTTKKKQERREKKNEDKKKSNNNQGEHKRKTEIEHSWQIKPLWMRNERGKRKEEVLRTYGTLG